MKTMLRLSLAIAITAIAAPALAQSVSDTFQVRATVQKSCMITATNLLDFSNGSTVSYDLSTNLDASTTFSYRCSKNTAFQIGLDAGSNPGAAAAFGSRAMVNGGEFLGYELYSDVAGGTVWGNAVGSWVTGNSGALAGVQNVTIFGRIPAGQDVTPTAPAAFYTDAAVTITVNY
jgi:spore coat protein U-like protein